MNYETRMKFDKHIITEEYVVGDMAYRAELDIQGLGFCSGMAGYEPCGVEVFLYEKGAEKPAGCVGISFALLKRSESTKSDLMLEPCPERGFTGNIPAVQKFTPYAERVIGNVVTEFLRQREAFTAMGYPLNSIRVSVGRQDSN